LPDDGTYNTAHSTPYLHGAAMMIRKEVIKKVGLMPEIYFLYYEELDWSSSMVENGYELWYEPRATVYHKESRSTGIDTPLKIFYLTRNRMLYASRHRKGLTKIASILYQLSFAATKNILKYILKGKTKQATAIWSGCLKFVTNDLDIYNN
ncbi:MAG: glycosyltransferase family 2 protein, partial [Rikenellaceae bacterium]